jgi:hypothetical protein
MTRDSSIRSALHADLEARYGADPHTAIIDEFSICRSRARADIVVVNGHFAAFEIKSDVDRLGRLSAQAAYYDRVFDEITVAAAPRHVPALEARLPGWYGIVVATAAGEGVALTEHRQPGRNPEPDLFARAQLLWREDMVELLLAAGATRALARAPRRTLLPQLLETLPAAELLDEIRRRVRGRAQAAR